jgi:hypothetical protein
MVKYIGVNMGFIPGGQEMQIYTNIYANFRLKIAEWSQLQRVMKEEGLNKSGALRMLFHLGIKAYSEGEKAGKGPASN